MEDPVVKRLAPRTGRVHRPRDFAGDEHLRYGRAEERPPSRKRLHVAPLVAEAGDAAIEARIAPVEIAFDNQIDPDVEVDADPEQIYRIVLNLIRNSVEALVERGTRAGSGWRACVTASACS